MNLWELISNTRRTLLCFLPKLWRLTVLVQPGIALLCQISTKENPISSFSHILIHSLIIFKFHLEFLFSRKNWLRSSMNVRMGNQTPSNNNIKTQQHRSPSHSLIHQIYYLKLVLNSLIAMNIQIFLSIDLQLL